MNKDKYKSIKKAVIALGGDYTAAESYNTFEGDYLWCIQNCCDNQLYQALPDSSTNYKGTYICTRDEFEQVKCGLHNKPDWKDAPEWASYLAQDDTGEWWYYENKPVHSDVGGFDSSKGLSKEYSSGLVFGDWNYTLEEKPLEGEPVKKELDNSWYDNDELPTVGVICECSLDFDSPKSSSNWNKIKVLYVDESTIVGEILEGSYDGNYSNGFETCIYKFRPVQSERDKLIEQAKALIESNRKLYFNTSSTEVQTIAELIVDAGWKPTK